MKDMELQELLSIFSSNFFMCWRFYETQKISEQVVLLACTLSTKWLVIACIFIHIFQRYLLRTISSETFLRHFLLFCYSVCCGGIKKWICDCFHQLGEVLNLTPTFHLFAFLYELYGLNVSSLKTIVKNL